MIPIKKKTGETLLESQKDVLFDNVLGRVGSRQCLFDTQGRIVSFVARLNFTGLSSSGGYGVRTGKQCLQLTVSASASILLTASRNSRKGKSSQYYRPTP
jgi:hypothetical protein